MQTMDLMQNEIQDIEQTHNSLVLTSEQKNDSAKLNTLKGLFMQNYRNFAGLNKYIQIGN